MRKLLHALCLAVLLSCAWAQEPQPAVVDLTGTALAQNGTAPNATAPSTPAIAPGTVYPSVTACLEAVGATTFLKVVRALSLDFAIDQEPYTVFVPTNQGFEQFFASANMTTDTDFNLQLLLETFNVSRVVHFHVSPQPLTLDVLPHGQLIQTYLKSDSDLDKLRITTDKLSSPPATIFRGWESSATVVTPNLAAGRSVVHLLDNVLLPRLPRDPGVVPYNSLDLMVFHKLGMLQMAIGAAGLWDGIKDLNKTVTIMAPTDQAIIGALQAMNTSLETVDPAQLTNLLRYHVADGFRSSHRMVEGATVFTWFTGRTWGFTRDANGTLMVVGEKNNATILVRDTFTGTGCVMHVIDQMLFPSSLADDTPPSTTMGGAPGAPAPAPDTPGTPATPAPAPATDPAPAPILGTENGKRRRMLEA